MKVLVLGAGGFIGSHLVDHIKARGDYVVGIDLKKPLFRETSADEFHLGDLAEQRFFDEVCLGAWDEIYQLAADMGGAGYIFTGENDTAVMTNSALINLNFARAISNAEIDVNKFFYSSSACIYPEYNQVNPDDPDCREESAYPAMPDSEYGWEKLFSERLYLALARNFGTVVRIARFHNIYGPYGVWRGGKEKAPAAICRKVMEGSDGGSIEIWGDGSQTRSFLYIDDCIDGIMRLMSSTLSQPVNIGSEEMISIRKLAEMVIELSGKSISIEYVPGPTGVRGRNSFNEKISAATGWTPSHTLRSGIAKTYEWISQSARD